MFIDRGHCPLAMARAPTRAIETFCTGLTPGSDIATKHDQSRGAQRYSVREGEDTIALFQSCKNTFDRLGKILQSNVIATSAGCEQSGRPPNSVTSLTPSHATRPAIGRQEPNLGQRRRAPAPAASLTTSAVISSCRVCRSSVCSSESMFFRLFFAAIMAATRASFSAAKAVRAAS